MPQTKKLSQRQEKDVALAYLCGVSESNVAANWNISTALITTQIMPKRVPTWNDPLVNFYRSTPQRQREANATHLYLCFNRNTIGDIVDPRNDANAFKFVYNSLFLPLEQEVVTKSGIAAMRSPENKTGVENLLDAVLNWDGDTGIISPFVIPELKRAYERKSESDSFKLSKVYERVLSTVAGKIKQGGLAITPRKVEILEEVLSTLTSNGREALQLLYSLEKGNLYTHEEVGKALGIVKKRVRQIKGKAIMQLQHPTRSRILESINGIKTSSDVEETYWRFKVKPKIKERVVPTLFRSPPPTPIKDFELSVRTRNCLNKMKITTLEELAKKTEVDLLSYRNFGETNLIEIGELLKSQGLKLAEFRMI